MRSRWVLRLNPETNEKELVPVHQENGPIESFHTVIQDSIDPTLSHADGQVYTSKAAMLRAARAAGAEPLTASDVRRKLEAVRSGSASMRGAVEPRATALRDAVEKAYSDLLWNRAPREHDLPTAEEVRERMLRK